MNLDSKASPCKPNIEIININEISNQYSTDKTINDISKEKEDNSFISNAPKSKEEDCNQDHLDCKGQVIKKINIIVNNTNSSPNSNKDRKIKSRNKSNDASNNNKSVKSDIDNNCNNKIIKTKKRPYSTHNNIQKSIYVMSDLIKNIENIFTQYKTHLKNSSNNNYSNFNYREKNIRVFNTTTSLCIDKRENFMVGKIQNSFKASNNNSNSNSNSKNLYSKSKNKNKKTEIFINGSVICNNIQNAYGNNNNNSQLYNCFSNITKSPTPQETKFEINYSNITNSGNILNSFNLNESYSTLNFNYTNDIKQYNTTGAYNNVVNNNNTCYNQSTTNNFLNTKRDKTSINNNNNFNNGINNVSSSNNKHMSNYFYNRNNNNSNEKPNYYIKIDSESKKNSNNSNEIYEMFKLPTQQSKLDLNMDNDFVMNLFKINKNEKLDKNNGFSQQESNSNNNYNSPSKEAFKSNNEDNSKVNLAPLFSNLTFQSAKFYASNKNINNSINYKCDDDRNIEIFNYDKKNECISNFNNNLLSKIKSNDNTNTNINSNNNSSFNNNLAKSLSNKYDNYFYYNSLLEFINNNNTQSSHYTDTDNTGLKRNMKEKDNKIIDYCNVINIKLIKLLKDFEIYLGKDFISKEHSSSLNSTIQNNCLNELLCKRVENCYNSLNGKTQIDRTDNKGDVYTGKNNKTKGNEKNYTNIPTNDLKYFTEFDFKINPTSDLSFIHLIINLKQLNKKSNTNNNNSNIQDNCYSNKESIITHTNKQKSLYPDNYIKSIYEESNIDNLACNYQNKLIQNIDKKYEQSINKIEKYKKIKSICNFICKNFKGLVDKMILFEKQVKELEIKSKSVSANELNFKSRVLLFNIETGIIQIIVDYDFILEQEKEGKVSNNDINKDKDDRDNKENIIKKNENSNDDKKVTKDKYSSNEKELKILNILLIFDKLCEQYQDNEIIKKDTKNTKNIKDNEKETSLNVICTINEDNKEKENLIFLDSSSNVTKPLSSNMFKTNDATISNNDKIKTKMDTPKIQIINKDTKTTPHSSINKEIEDKENINTINFNRKKYVKKNINKNKDNNATNDNNYIKYNGNISDITISTDNSQLFKEQNTSIPSEITKKNDSYDQTNTLSALKINNVNTVNNSDNLSVFTSMSKRPKYKIYDPNSKFNAIELASKIGANEASRFLKIPLKSLKRWMLVGHERIKGGGRKVKVPGLEEKIISWYNDLVSKKVEINAIMIRDKALSISNDPDFYASKGWIEKLKKKHKLILSDIRRSINNNNKIKEIKRHLIKKVIVDAISKKSNDNDDADKPSSTNISNITNTDEINNSKNDKSVKYSYFKAFSKNIISKVNANANADNKVAGEKDGSNPSTKININNLSFITNDSNNDKSQSINSKNFFVTAICKNKFN